MKRLECPRCSRVASFQARRPISGDEIGRLMTDRTFSRWSTRIDYGSTVVVTCSGCGHEWRSYPRGSTVEADPPVDLPESDHWTPEGDPTEIGAIRIQYLRGRSTGAHEVSTGFSQVGFRVLPDGDTSTRFRLAEIKRHADTVGLGESALFQLAGRLSAAGIQRLEWIPILSR